MRILSLLDLAAAIWALFPFYTFVLFYTFKEPFSYEYSSHALDCFQYAHSQFHRSMTFGMGSIFLLYLCTAYLLWKHSCMTIDPIVWIVYSIPFIGWMIPF